MTETEKMSFEQQQEIMFRMNTRQLAIEILEQLYNEGYRYVVRDKDSDFLTCFSLKPKHYMDLESWGYVDENERGAKMAYIFRNTDVAEIKWSNRSATLIAEFLGLNKEGAE